jgi:magnesium and cobalt transporter
LLSAENRGLIGVESRGMLEGVIRMSDGSAGDVMVASPRMDMIEISDAFEEMLHQVIDIGHSRYPVYENTTDNIIGILHSKDLIKLQRAPELNIRTLLRAVVFVPESKNLIDLLREFRRNRNHMAIVKLMALSKSC